MSNQQRTTAEAVAAAGMGWHEAADKSLLAATVATAVLERLEASLAQTGRASLVVSGGSTPAPVFAQLADADIAWANITVTLADERWVPPGHADSNESLVRDTLLVNRASAATFVPLYRADVDPEQAPGAVAPDVQAMLNPQTVVILGMGGDGHTASLFPDAPAAELHSAMALDNTDVVAILHPPSVSQARISLTRAALLQAGPRFLHITGEDKGAVLLAALNEASGDAWQPGMAPVIGLLTESPGDVAVFWSP